MLMKDISAFRRELCHSRVYLSTWSGAIRRSQLPGFCGEQRPAAVLSSVRLQGLVMHPSIHTSDLAAQPSAGLFLHRACKQTCCMALSTTTWTLCVRGMTSHWLETLWPSSASSLFSSPVSNEFCHLRSLSSGSLCSFCVRCSNFSYISLLFLLLPSFTPFISALHLAARS